MADEQTTILYNKLVATYFTHIQCVRWEVSHPVKASLIQKSTSTSIILRSPSSITVYWPIRNRNITEEFINPQKIYKHSKTETGFPNKILPQSSQVSAGFSTYLQLILRSLVWVNIFSLQQDLSPITRAIGSPSISEYPHTSISEYSQVQKLVTITDVLFIRWLRLPLVRGKELISA